MYDIVIHFFLRLCSIYSYDEMLAIFPMLYKYILAVYFIHNSMHLYLLPLYCPYPPWNIIYSLKLVQYHFLKLHTAMIHSYPHPTPSCAVRRTLGSSHTVVCVLPSLTLSLSLKCKLHESICKRDSVVK